MLEAAHAVGAALDLLDAQVQSLGGPVLAPGAMVGEDLLPPGPQRLAEAHDLGHVVGEAAGDRPCSTVLEPRSNCRRGTRRGQDSLASQAPRTSSLGSPMRRPNRSRWRPGRRAGEQQLADQVERVGLVAPVAEGLVLHPPAHLIQASGSRPAPHGTDRRPGGRDRGPGTSRLGSSRARSVATTSIPAAHSGSAAASHRRRSAAMFPSSMSTPRMASARPVPSLTRRSLRRCCLQTAVTMARPLPRVVDPLKPTPIPAPTRRASNPAVTSRRGSAGCLRS